MRWWIFQEMFYWLTWNFHCLPLQFLHVCVCVCVCLEIEMVRRKTNTMFKRLTPDWWSVFFAWEKRDLSQQFRKEYVSSFQTVKLLANGIIFLAFPLKKMANSSFVSDELKIKPQVCRSPPPTSGSNWAEVGVAKTLLYQWKESRVRNFNARVTAIYQKLNSSVDAVRAKDKQDSYACTRELLSIWFSASTAFR